MKILKIVLIAFLSLSILVTAVGYIQPDKVEVVRSRKITGTPHQIFPMIVDLRNWDNWSAWREMDPDMQVSYKGNKDSVPSSMEWKSQVLGDGKLSITNVFPLSSFNYRMNLADMEGPEIFGYITIQIIDDKTTELTWTQKLNLGDSPFTKLFGLFADQALGPDIERGLDNIGSKVEAEN